jgi:SAM-dependent methyltransferase
VTGVSAWLPTWLRLGIRELIEGNRVIRGLHLREIAPELDLIEAELAAMHGPWHGFATDRVTTGMTERVVEIPWILSRYAGERRVLEVGPTFAYTTYITHLSRLGIEELHGLDLSTRPVRGIDLTRGDVREMPYPDGHFDLVHCVSTIEHVGLDVTKYGVDATRAHDDGDTAALREMRRVLAPGGHIRITVPFGRAETLDWMRQYDLAAWQRLVDDSGVGIEEMEVYGYSETEGWRRREAPDLPAGGYRELGAPAGTGVLCASLKPSPA